jgi:hypothetical protein
MGMKNHRSLGPRGVGSSCIQRARSWLAAMLWVTTLGASVLAACAPASARSARAPFGDVRLEKERETLLRQRARERLRLELDIRDHDGRSVRDGG